jgi:hypothetical protein
VSLSVRGPTDRLLKWNGVALTFMRTVKMCIWSREEGIQCVVVHQRALYAVSKQLKLVSEETRLSRHTT